MIKFKFLSILALLLTVTQGAWAQTTADIGRVIAADGKMYKTVTLANKVSTASGVVAYVGSSEVDLETGHKHLAISLADIGQGAYGGEGNAFESTSSDLATVLTWINGRYVTINGHDQIDRAEHPALDLAYNYSTARPSGASIWFVASVGQWNMVVKGLTGSNTDLSESVNSDLAYDKVNVKIVAAGATGLILAGSNYVLANPYDKDYVWEYMEEGYVAHWRKSADWYVVRPIFSFLSATNGYVVEYNANGGSGAPAAQSKTHGTALTLSSTVPTRDGYTFAGWNTKADGSGTPYAAGGSYTTDNDVVLYAQWTAIPTHSATWDATDSEKGNWSIDHDTPYEGQAVKATYNGTKHVKRVKVKAIPTVTLSKTALDFDADYYKGSTQTFTVTRDGDGAITATSDNTNQATVSVDGNTVTVTRKYPGEGSAVITVSVAATESYAAAANQTVNVTFSSMSRHLGGVEAKNKGWFLGADGYVYPSIAAATNADTEARAVIAHVGAIEKYCDHAICLALEDAAGAVVWSDATSAAQSWAASHAVSLGETNYNTSHTTYDWVQNNASVSSQTRDEGIGYGWRIPSVTDWRYIMQAFGGPSATDPVGVAMAVYGNTVRSAINTACGNSGLNTVAYWTCSTLTGDDTIRWGVHFQNGDNDNKDVFWTYGQSVTPNLRLVFAY